MNTSRSTEDLEPLRQRREGFEARELRSYFADWLTTLDPGLRQALVEPRSWWTIAAFVAAILGAATWVPAARAFFEIDSRIAALSFAPTLALGLRVGALQRRGQLSLARFGALCLIGSALFQWFTWVLVAAARMPAATVMAALPVLLAAYHGHAFRSSSRHPFIAMGTCAAVLAAWPLAKSAEHIGVFLVGGLIAVGASLILGGNALGQVRAASERDAFREAIHAQLLNDRTSHADHLARILLDLRSNNHDAGTALSGALINMDLLLRRLESTEVIEHVADDVIALTTDVVVSLRNLHSLVDQARRDAAQESPARELIDVPAVIQRVLAEVRARFPELTVEAIHPPACGLRLLGGSLVLERILRNVVVNACEGNGRQGPKAVAVECRADGDSVVFEVRDDGPGFSPEQLHGTELGQRSTKPRGTGLGLYTVTKLVRAQDGTAVFRNATGGGATVCVTLPSGLREVPV